MRQLLFLCAALMAAASAKAQTVELGVSRCEGCRVRLERRATLGQEFDRYAIDRGLTVTASDRGEYLVASFSSPGEIAIYGPDGALRRVISRSGAGPGEFRSISRLRAFGEGRIAAFDPRLLRLTVFTEHGTAALVSLPFSAVGDIQPFSHGLLVQGTVHAGAQSGFPLHLVDTTGSAVRSIGIAETLAPGETAVPRAVAVLADGSILLAGRTGYSLEHYAPDGALIRILARNVSWFPDTQDRRTADPLQAPPRPSIVGIQQDSAGLLWVLVRVPDLDWSAGAAAEQRESGDIDDVYDTIIDVIDLDAAAVLATARSGRYLFSLLPRRGAASRRQQPNGVLLIDVWTLSLSRNSASPPPTVQPAARGALLKP